MYTILILLHVITNFVLAYNYHVNISVDDPIVKGGTIHFVARVYEGNEILDDKNLKFYWQDNAIPQHNKETDTKNATDLWSVTYKADLYAEGAYIAGVIVKVCLAKYICYEVASARTYFFITETLNGEMLLTQEDGTLYKDCILNTSTVTHEIDVKETDWDYIKNATVLTYWFVDCTLYGITSDRKFYFNYTSENHTVEALMVAYFSPLPQMTTLAHSTKTCNNNNNQNCVITETSNTSTAVSTSDGLNLISKALRKSNPDATDNVIVNGMKMPLPYVCNGTQITTDASKTYGYFFKTVRVKVTAASTAVSTSDGLNLISKTLRKSNPDATDNVIVNGMKMPLPYVRNGTQITTDASKTYGYFFKNVRVKAPITDIKITGKNRIKQGDLLSLRVQCQGSGNIEYCVEYKRGAYNVTGNETCYVYRSLEACDFPINRYLQDSSYTVLIIIRNEISKIVLPVTVTVYEVATQTQLLVITVVIVVSLVAAIVIAFGIICYIRNRTKHNRTK